MFRRAQNDSYRIVAAIYKQTNKQTNKHEELNVFVTQVTCTWFCRS